MKIHKLDIKGFGRIENLEVVLKDGFNLIYGSNESGKSTIQWFIRGMFYSLKGGRCLKEGDLPPLKKFKPWSGGAYKGSLKYSLLNGDEYVVERDFNEGTGAIFNNLYKDISYTFDQSRDIGPMFAQKHMGLNEGSFEKTIFISQLKTVFSKDSKEELLDRLANVSECGNEEVSFNRARAVLRDTLKDIVGTEKTSKSPLDKLNTKLEELKAKREELLKNKDEIFSIEVRSKDILRELNFLDNQKKIFLKAGEIVEFSKEIEELKRKRSYLLNTLKDIGRYKEEENVLSKELLEKRRILEEKSSFARFNSEDVDIMTINYEKYCELETNCENLNLQIENLEKQVETIEVNLEEYKNMREIFEDIEKLLLNFEVLKNIGSYNYYDIPSSRDNKIQTDYKSGLKTGLWVSGLTFWAIFIYYFIKNSRILIPMLIISGIATVYYLYKNILLKRVSGGKKHIINKKLENSRLEESKNQLVEILEKSQSQTIEELLAKKAIYNKLVGSFTDLNNKIEALAKELQCKKGQMTKMEESIFEYLLITGILNKKSTTSEEDVDKFKKGVNGYKESLKEINYYEERKKDLEGYLNKMYIRAAQDINMEIQNEYGLELLREEINKNIGEIYEKVDIIIEEIKDYQGEMPENFLEGLLDNILDVDTKEAKIYVDRHLEDIDKKKIELHLNKRENDTILSTSLYSDIHIDTIEDEIQMLQKRKDELKDIGFSLRTALDVLEESQREIKKSFVPFLNERISCIISCITKGEYNMVRSDEELGLSTVDPFTNQIVRGIFLSGGTVDQIYLALRISMVEFFEKNNEPLPVIMDEVLAQYDDERAFNTLEFLYNLSLKRQIIFFTCKKRDVEMATSLMKNINLIEL